MRLFFINLLSFIIISIATFLFFSFNTIYILSSFILLILMFSILLILLGSEFFAIVYTLVYIGVIFVFFLFVILLVDLRLEVRNSDKSSIVYAAPLNIILSILFFVVSSLLLDVVICQEFSDLEELSSVQIGRAHV